MRDYKAPELELLMLSDKDVIATSPGTETSIIDDPFGAWELSETLD